MPRLITTHEELVQNNGRRVTCIIDEHVISDAKIVVEGVSNHVFIVQNVCNGSRPTNTLGYRYGWNVSCSYNRYENYTSKEATEITLVEEEELVQCINDGFTHESLLQLHGRRVSCFIQDNVIPEGRICVEDDHVYVCQNVFEGTKPTNTFGYRCGYCISTPRCRYESVESNPGVIREMVLLPETAGETQTAIPQDDDYVYIMILKTDIRGVKTVPILFRSMTHCYISSRLESLPEKDRSEYYEYVKIRV